MIIKLTLFTILSIVGLFTGIFLRDVKCSDIQDFLYMEELYSRQASTVFAVEHFVIGNRRCFVSLLYHLNKGITDANHIDMKKFEIYSKYRDYIFSSLHLLNYDVFAPYEKQIKKFVTTFNAWRNAKKPEEENTYFSQLKSTVKSLIKPGLQTSMFSSNKRYLTDYIEKRYDSHKGDDGNFDLCNEMYKTNGYKSYSVLLNVMDECFQKEKIQKLLYFKSFPQLMDSGITTIKNSIDEFKDNLKVYDDILLSVIQFYEEYTIKFIKQSIVILQMTVEEGKPVEVTGMTVKTYMAITDNIIKNVRLLKEKMVTLSKLKPFQNISFTLETFNKNYNLSMKSYGELRTTIMDGKAIETRITESIEEIDTYPSLLPYYVNYKKLKKSLEENKTLNRLLNLQAWAAVLPLYIRMFINIYNEDNQTFSLYK